MFKPSLFFHLRTVKAEAGNSQSFGGIKIISYFGTESVVGWDKFNWFYKETKGGTGKFVVI